MNKTEARYSEQLDIEQSGGIVLSWAYEAVKLRLAKATFYTPDFMVMRSDGTIEFHEVKGFWRDDARVKIKVAADKYPMFSFVAVQWHKKTWQYEQFGSNQ